VDHVKKGLSDRKFLVSIFFTKNLNLNALITNLKTENANPFAIVKFYGVKVGHLEFRPHCVYWRVTSLWPNDSGSCYIPLEWALILLFIDTKHGPCSFTYTRFIAIFVNFRVLRIFTFLTISRKFYKGTEWNYINLESLSQGTSTTANSLETCHREPPRKMRLKLKNCDFLEFLSRHYSVIST